MIIFLFINDLFSTTNPTHFRCSLDFYQSFLARGQNFYRMIIPGVIVYLRCVSLPHMIVYQRGASAHSFTRLFFDGDQIQANWRCKYIIVTVKIAYRKYYIKYSLNCCKRNSAWVNLALFTVTSSFKTSCFTELTGLLGKGTGMVLVGFSKALISDASFSDFGWQWKRTEFKFKPSLISSFSH